MSHVPDVVVTGLGATTPLGGDVPTTWAAALERRVRRAALRQRLGRAIRPARRVRRDHQGRPAEVLTRPEIKRMDPSAQYAIIAAREAWADAGSPEVDGDRLGSVVSSGIGGICTILDAWEALSERRRPPGPAHDGAMLMPNSPTAYVSLEFGARAGRTRSSPPAPRAPRPSATAST